MGKEMKISQIDQSKSVQQF